MVPSSRTSWTSVNRVGGGDWASESGYTLMRLPYATALAMSSSLRLASFDCSDATPP